MKPDLFVVHLRLPLVPLLKLLWDVFKSNGKRGALERPDPLEASPAFNTVLLYDRRQLRPAKQQGELSLSLSASLSPGSYRNA